jgi:hypothetical protein
MTSENDREHLLEELRAALDLTGARPSRWPEGRRARLAAFIESDQEAARLFVEAKALDRVLGLAARNAPAAGLEARILEAAAALPREPRARLAMAPAQPLALRPKPARRFPARTHWGEIALLAASLAAGIYIGLSGQAVPALRNVMFIAANQTDSSMAMSGSLFESSSLQDKEQL